VQYLGRLARSQTAKVIYDYRDGKIGYFERLFKKRMRYYRELQKKGYEVRLGEGRLF
jgi:hypothetical protein